LVRIFVPVTYKKKENKRKETLETFLKGKKEHNPSLTTYLSVRIFVLATLQKEKKEMLEMFLKNKGIKLSIYLKKKAYFVYSFRQVGNPTKREERNVRNVSYLPYTEEKKTY
jgi:hypothetical protein